MHADLDCSVAHSLTYSSCLIARGRSSAGLERCPVTAEVAGSNPVAPAILLLLVIVLVAYRKSGGYAIFPL